jgi:hypothetical protein
MLETLLELKACVQSANEQVKWVTGTARDDDRTYLGGEFELIHGGHASVHSHSSKEGKASDK